MAKQSTPLRFPSFLRGAARVTTLTGKLDTYVLQTDKEALQHDWKVTGEDIRNAASSYVKSSKK